MAARSNTGSGPRRTTRVAAVFALLCLCLLLASSASAALPPSTVSPDGASATAPHLKVSLVSSAAAIAPGAGFQTGLHFELDKGWHVYWLNAGDSGEPPSIKWTLPKGITAGPMQFPAPQRLPLGSLMDFGYPNEVLYPMDMEVAPAFHAGTLAVLSAKVDWLVCNESCIPGAASLSLKLPTSAKPAVNAAGQQLIQQWNARIPKPLADSGAAFNDRQTSFVLFVPTHAVTTSAHFFPADKDLIDNSAPQQVSPIKGGIRIELKKDSDLLKTPSTGTNGVANLNGVVVLGDGSAYQIHATRGGIIGGASTTPGQSAPAHSDTSLLQALGLAFVGGIILNLMPCVFPVLFIKALSLVQSSQSERRHMRLHGLVYTLGILASFWIVVGVLLALRAGGRHLGWGFQFQSPEFLAVMALLLFFLGLSLAGMFEIGLTLTSAGGSLAQKQGYSGSFFTGVLAMVVATPCTAPFMGVAIGYALAQPSWVSFLVFTALGVGLAAPYLMLAFQPSWTRILPRPGAWMEVLKQATAIPIFGTVIWLVWLFTSSTNATALTGLLLAFLLLGIAGWVLGRWPARRIPLLAALLVIAAAVAAPIYATHHFAEPVLASTETRASSQTHPSSTVLDPKDWQPFTPSIVASYQAQGRPVLVDFTAKWCLSCQVNERVVLDRPDVEARLHASGIALVRADWTHHDDDIAQALAELNRSGVPAYALYPAAAGSPPVMLPEVLTPGIVYSAIDQIAVPPAGSKALLAVPVH